jgi:hypothetical protein
MEEYNNSIVEHIKSIVDRIHNIQKIKKMYEEMLDKVNEVNKNLDEDNKVSVIDIIKNISCYSLSIIEKKKQLKTILKQLAHNIDITL